MNGFSKKTLLRLIERATGMAVGTVSFRRVPTGKFNTTFEVSTGSGSYILRIAPPDDAGFIFYERRMMAQEPDLYRCVRDNTTVPVPDVYLYDDSRDLIDRDYIVMERLPGRPLTEAGPGRVSMPRVLETVGDFLKQIHGITANQYGYLGAHRPMAPASTWGEAFETMWRKLLDDLVACGGYSDDDRTYMANLFDRNRPLFDTQGPARLLHMDVWHQNILVDDTGEVTGLIDMDRALWGDPEIEFAVLDYCGISEPPFWQGYGSRRDTSPDARRRALFYLLYEIQKYVIIRMWRTHDPRDAARYRAESFRIAQTIV
ncbi:MAG: aminoglycoside phosphotransferase family protein [Candidatus Hydrogenedentes bacterium]|nr:aminoglycoside phosphotransferase family protein [Candidatus Hydrogenedentota bacterium]